MNIDTLVPERFFEKHPEHRGEYAREPVKRQMGEHLATFAKRKDGTEFPMATALSATRTQKGLLITCIVQDLSHGFFGKELKGWNEDAETESADV